MIATHWNKTVNKRTAYSDSARDYIRMSDLGKPYLDRYYSMQGLEVTNPFEERVLRIFDAGRVMEFIVLRALAMAGILNHKQLDVNISASGKNLEVRGHLDCTIGGFPDYETAKDKIQSHLKEYGLDIDNEVVEQKAIQILEGLKEMKVTNLEEMVVEVKSINSMSFWAHKNRDDKNNFLGYIHNKLQTYGYMKGTGHKKGILLYISKDDFVIEEIALLLGDQDLEALYQKDVETMSHYWNNKIQPPKEDDIVWNERKKGYEVNWRIVRSQYCDLIVGRPKEEWLEEAEKKVRELNLELKWKRQAEENGLDIEGKTPEEVKKICMAYNRQINKDKKELAAKVDMNAELEEEVK